MNTPLVSVIVPAWNAAATLEDTLRSALSSDYPALEVLVVDDGSTDATLDIARRLAAGDERLRVFTEANGGVCRARNLAISQARGVYIMPLDADDRIGPHFIAEAVRRFEEDTTGLLKAVFPKIMYFGDRSGEAHLPSFRLSLLARKNILPITALYRRADALRQGGYCEEIIAREDWAFWIALFKDGGTLKRLEEQSWMYRVSADAKHVRDRQLKRHVVNVLNILHADLFERELGGPLRYHRTASRLLNRLNVGKAKTVVNEAYPAMKAFAASLPWRFALDSEKAPSLTGRVMYKKRNEIRLFDTEEGPVVVKSFQIPHIANKFAYGFFRRSKARRSFEYAAMLNASGFCSPEPLAYVERRWLGWFSDSYYVCRQSRCRFAYADLIGGQTARTGEVMQAIGTLTARLHEAGMIHRDYARGNLLFDFFDPGADRPSDNGAEVRVELIDLNRIRFHRVGLEEGCANFDRLPGTPEMAAVAAEAYCRRRGYEGEDKEKAVRLIAQAMAAASKK